jgi:FlaG/FlaF family flagellin (archaellin)
MKKTLTMLAVAGLTATIAAAPAGAAKPTTTKVPSASTQCKSEKAGMGDATFKQTYGTNANRSNAMGKCVSKRTAATNAARKAAKGDATKTAKTVKAQVAGDINAAKTCKAAKQADATAFGAKYGTHRNAFGKCVSATAKQQSEGGATS